MYNITQIQQTLAFLRDVIATKDDWSHVAEENYQKAQLTLRGVYEEQVTREHKRMQGKTRTAKVEFGFASYQNRSFELIVRDVQTGEETVLKGILDPGQLVAVDRILPTCVFVKGVPQVAAG